MKPHAFETGGWRKATDPCGYREPLTPGSLALSDFCGEPKNALVHK